MPRFLGQVGLGSLTRDGIAQPRPVRPWLIDLSLLKPVFPLVPGDISDFETAPDFSRWVLGDTPSDETLQLRWNIIEDKGRQLLVCDRMILTRVSWDDLHAAGYVTGRQVLIDGRSYICRLLTGGNDFQVPDDGYKGGSPVNEWDRYIGTDTTVGDPLAPIAHRVSSELTEEDLTSLHNQLWNWLGAVSWTQEPYLHRATARCCRGFQSARFFYLNTQSHRHEDIGWRPVLELI